MTTASSRLPTGTAGLVWGAAAATGVGVILVVAGAVIGGAAATYGAVIGTVLVVGVLAFGAFSVNLVAGVMPAASFIVALVTYSAQLVTGVVVLVLLQDSGLLTDGTIDRAWLGAAVVLATLAWCAGQIVALKRVRMPIYDLPEASAR